MVALCCSVLLGFLAFASQQPGRGTPEGPAPTDMTLREIANKRLHHGNGRFINPLSAQHYRNFGEVLRWKLLAKNDFTRLYDGEQVLPVHIDFSAIEKHHGLSVTFVTHATLLIRDRGTTILVDPVLSGLFWPIRDCTPLDFPLERMPDPAYVLITHGHYDHLDIRSLKRFADSARYISPLGYRDILEDAGAASITELDWFDAHHDGSREIILLPCNHWTMRNPITGPNTALWGSYLIRSSTGPTIFVSGDTAYFDRFDEIGQEFAIDLAIFNLGAYEPRWFMEKSHINPEDTVRAFQELGATKLMVVHWGTFRLGDEPVHFPPIDIRREMEKAGMLDRLIEISHGGTIYFDETTNVWQEGNESL